MRSSKNPPNRRARFTFLWLLAAACPPVHAGFPEASQTDISARNQTRDPAPTDDDTPSRLETAPQAGRFVVTSEISPPVSFAPDDLLAKAGPLAGLADAVNLTDGASARAHMSALAAAALLVREGIEPILQLTCRDRNRIALQADLMGAAALGVRNLLLLTGDDPKAGDQPETKPVFDLDSTALTAVARHMRDQGELPTGKAIAGRAPPKPKLYFLNKIYKFCRNLCLLSYNIR